MKDKAEGTRLRRSHGTEGPTWDPYGYEEIVVERPSRPPVTLHFGGLMTWIAIGDQKIDAYDNEEEAHVMALFEHTTGMTLEQFERYYARIKYRCPLCGCRNLRTESGYPGESFNVCPKDGTIVSSNFHPSEIE